MKPLILAVQFLTIIPLRTNGVVSGKEMSGSTVFFPAAGALQGLLVGCAALLATHVFSTEISSGLVLLTLVLSNGGFHLDGLADTFDALAVKSSGDKVKDKKKRLEVMKDSSTGAIGAAAIALSILLKFTFLKDVITSSQSPACYAFLFLMPVFSKWGMVPAMYHGKAARQDGLGKLFMEHLGTTQLFLSALLLFVLFAAADILFLQKEYGAAPIGLFCILFALFYLFSIMSALFFKNRFGGTTGDTLGATGEISEILFLAVVSLWLQLFI